MINCFDNVWQVVILVKMEDWVWLSGEYYYIYLGLVCRDREEIDESFDKIENVYEIFFVLVFYVFRIVYQEFKIDF